MTNATKLALEESLKRLLLKKPLDKITINDLTTDCGISRMTFYYHFMVPLQLPSQEKVDSPVLLKKLSRSSLLT